MNENELPPDLEVGQWKREEIPRKVKDLIENPHNGREITREQFAHLKYSIKNYGLTDEPLINFDGRLIAGHMRKRALEDLGWKEVYCKVPPRPITEDEFDRLSLRHNLNTGRFDYDVLIDKYEIPILFECGFTVEDFHLDSGNKEEKPKKKEKECPNCGEKL